MKPHLYPVKSDLVFLDTQLAYTASTKEGGHGEETGPDPHSTTSAHSTRAPGAVERSAKARGRAPAPARRWQRTSQTWRSAQLAGFAHTVHATDAVAVGAMGNVRWFCAALRSCRCRLAVTNSNQFEVISRSVKKTGAHDAEVLAEFLAKGLLQEIRMKDGVSARIASLAQNGDKLVKLRTALKNKVKTLAVRGILLPKESLASEKGLAADLAGPCPSSNAWNWTSWWEIRHLNASIAKLEVLLQEQGPQLQGWTNLTSIAGIGGPWARASCSPRLTTSPISLTRASSRPILESCRGPTTPTPPNSAATSPNGGRSGAAPPWPSPADRDEVQFLLTGVLPAARRDARHWQGNYRAGLQVPGGHLSDPKVRLGVCGLPAVSSDGPLR